MLPNNRLTFFLVFAVLLVAGSIFVATPAIAVDGTLSVPDADSLKADIQVNGIEGQPVTFELTITYDEVVTGFDVTDIELYATWDDNGEDSVITNGATAGAVTPTGDSAVFTSEITAKSNVEKVWIDVDAAAATTPGRLVGGSFIAGDATNGLDQIIVEIIRRPPPIEITVSGDTTISGDGPFTVTLTATTAITLTKADIEVTGGLIESLSSDAANEVWTVTITPGVGKTEIIVEPAANSTFTFPRHTVIVDLTVTAPVIPPELTVSGDTTISGDGPFTVTLTSTTAITLTKADIEVTGGLIESLSSDAANEVWTVTITPGVGKTEIIVEPAANSTFTFPRHTVTVDPPVTDTVIPLTMSEGTAIGASPSFMIILRSAAGTPVTLTSADIKVTGGSVQTLTPDAAKEIWTVTIIRFVGQTQVTVEPADPTKYSFPSRTFTVDSTGPMATITGTPPPTGGPFAITISFDEPLQAGATLAANEITVTGGSLSTPTAVANTNDFTATITPNPGVTTVTVQVKANAVADALGNQNAATPSPAHPFTFTTLTVSGDTTISGDGPFTVTLTSTTAITLTKADIKVTGGLIESLSSDAANEVWTVTITPGVGKTEIIVEPAANGAYTFPRHTVTVDPPVTDTAIPLTMSEGTTIGTSPSFMIILRSAAGTPVTLTSADIKVTGGSVQTLTSDAAKEIWTVTIIRFVGQTQVTVEPADPTKYSFPSRTFTVDSTGPMATITGTPPPTGGPFAITISFDEPLQAGATLAANEITVTGGSLSTPTAVANTNDFTATITPNPGVTTVTVQVKANAVADALGNQNAATPSPAHPFTVSTTTVQTRTEPTLDVIFSEIANRTDDTNEWIEFKNRSGQPQDVDGWIVSIVTAVNSDVQLFKLPDVTIPDGGVLLVTDKDPVDQGSSQGSSLFPKLPLWERVDMGALPNSGNFMLILRKSDDANLLGTANQIADIAGYYPSSSHGTTNLWPLHRYDAPHDKNNLSANKVYWRQHEDQVGTGGTANTEEEVAFQPIGFTGIGYQRDVDPTDENGGTPGYPNDVRKGRESELTDDVTISEIMFANDRGRNDIQWIELYNSSKTDAVALDADDGWSLFIENYNDPSTADEPLSGIINFKDNGNVKTILPNQTVLIVSSSRGGSSDSAHFPSNRVFGVYEEIPDEFGMIDRRDPFLNPTVGFYIELVDGRNRPVDEVGNLDNRPRSAGEPVWKLPNGRTADGYRTSIIRRYRDYNPRTRGYSNIGMVHDGTQREGWIRASETKFTYFLRRTNTWYGLNSDYGSPGIRSGQVLPVQLSQFRPKLTEAGTVVIEWTTESELDNAGFNILRSRTETGEFKIVNAQLIQGAGTTSERNTYTWTDTTTEPNVAYYYRIEDVSLTGERQTLAISRLKGLISAKGKLVTQWAGLKKSQD